MAYVAMARKWRPQSFSDMVGQEHIAKTLQNAIEGGRLHHAFLFTGTRGVGKTTSARILARTLNCTGGDPLHPCGECPSCKDFAGGNPMDIFEIDAASNTGVDNIRDVIERVQYPPVIGKYKIFIIDEVHMLSTGAFNALLKTLEEPPEHVIFIFATTEVNKVPQTILSRVQRFDFKRLSVEQVRSRLRYICEQENINASDETLDVFAEKADGSMRDGLTYFDQAYAFTGSEMTAEAVRSVLGIPPVELFFTLINAIESHDLKACFHMVDDACKRGIEFTPLLDGFGKFLRNLLYSRLDAFTADALNVSDEMYSKYKSAVPGLGNVDILRISKMLIDLQGTLRYSTNPRLLVETTFARMAWLDRIVDLRRALAAINDPANASASADQEALKKKVTDVQNMLDAQEEAKALQQAAENPFAAMERGISGGYYGDVYSRYEVAAAWGSIRNRINDDGDFAFSVALNDSVLETGNIQETPFPIALTYVGDAGKDAWGPKQMEEHPEYLERLKQILENCLQTPVALSVKTRALNAQELHQRMQAQMSPYELDIQKEPGLQRLKELFNAELIYSRKSKRQVTVQQTEEDLEMAEQDN
ncbi:DNA polymerase-3 subunit gamma/tau [Fibrobacter sp. UWH9]|uniref:DNA polymerase III subunit gamma/tau n=1 Tax=unclassified Fibrobacter TaxID=2634177 RepID=UPI0009222934|nr:MULTISPECIES: DNA polymerase III subunit gamma/tau [Fibrobacter]MCQ2099669.1 DNA polymerase III subunit gamma/tau [Fibrobacter sp.]MCL4101574.1 Holliday junction ATP-dependent DNA helicase RuvB [Fibrobacter succinogenes]MDO4947058.1 DNA polymerase III subunit gamma/tau [Fibrobacter sp.]OWV07736.1 DNA polymerase III subunit gamma/tau [Fibrobacter sp. UWH3]OWV17343.1 DNA polymerase III subunit gamma/tau [Fibrobacter sp. UWH1]